MAEPAGFPRRDKTQAVSSTPPEERAPRKPRKRTFIAESRPQDGATSPAPQPLPPLLNFPDSPPSVAPPPQTNEDEDIPVLTEVVSVEPAPPEKKPSPLDDIQFSLLASDIAHAIGQQLANELPALLDCALHNKGEDLRASINTTMETALREFIARRKQLHLPLEEPSDVKLP